MKLWLSVFLCFCSLGLQAQSNRILLDEAFDDWNTVQVLATDPSGDNGSSDIDFGRLWMSQDDDYLFFRLELGTEVNLQNDNKITLYLDADHDASSGQAIGGIGAELVYNFGNREGWVYRNSSIQNVRQVDIGLVSSPTITASEFEIAIKRDLTFQGQSLFSGNEIRVRFHNAMTGADQLPDTAGGVSYTFQNQSPDPLPTYSISKLVPTHTRVLSYNVLRDDLFDPNKQGNFTRILQAIAPDLIGFQEIYDNSSAQTAAKVSALLPLIVGNWYHAKVEPDIIAVSKYPIISSHTINPGGNGAFLIDMGPVQTLFIVAHPPCCNNNFDRQSEIDGIMAFVRNVQTGTVPFSLPTNSPIIIAGDMNLVGFRRQQQTLLTGSIFNQFTYGAAFDPDWNGTALEDAKPYTTGVPFTMTWYSEGSSFSPGRLDYIVYSGSVMSLENSYSLFTPGLTPAELANYSLQAQDAVIASDHLPLVADFDLGLSTSISSSSLSSALKLDYYPNPLTSLSKVHYYLPKHSAVRFQLFHANGQLVFRHQLAQAARGNHTLELTGLSLPPGIYVGQLQTAYGQVQRKIVVLR